MNTHLWRPRSALNMKRRSAESKIYTAFISMFASVLINQFVP